MSSQSHSVACTIVRCTVRAVLAQRSRSGGLVQRGGVLRSHAERVLAFVANIKTDRPRERPCASHGAKRRLQHKKVARR
jgi:hypothetical protein